MARGIGSHAPVVVSAAPRDTCVIIVRFSAPQPVINPVAVLGEGVDFVRPIDAPGHGAPGWDTGSAIGMKASSLSILSIVRALLATAVIVLSLSMVVVMRRPISGDTLPTRATSPPSLTLLLVTT
eukprot:11919905-Ditylum_brightwellii.AAC.1